jgi:hypothetical protein
MRLYRSLEIQVCCFKEVAGSTAHDLSETFLGQGQGKAQVKEWALN